MISKTYKKGRKSIFYGIFLLWGLCFSHASYSAVYPLPAPGNSVVGKLQWTQSKPGDNFSILGRRYDVGYYELVEANPGVDPDLPNPGTIVVIPTRYVLPNAPRNGLVINLAELRLYYYPSNKNIVITYPVGIGREGWSTPEGGTTVIGKVVNPTWVVPPDIMADRAAHGIKLPPKVTPGPDDPLGGYALYLGFPGYRIHGTNDPSGIGRRSSSGCIRMLPEDVETLFDFVKTGTRVHVVNDAFKAGWDNGKLYLESHVPLQEQQVKLTDNSALVTEVIAQATAKRRADINWTMANKIAHGLSGMPIPIGVTANSTNTTNAMNTVNKPNSTNTVG